MFRFLLTFVFVSLGSAVQVFAQQPEPVSWLIFQDGQYAEAQDQRPGDTGYLRIDPQRHSESTLTLRSSNSFFMFINGKLIGEFDGVTRMKIDSLSSIYSSGQLIIAIHQKNLDTREFKVALTNARSKRDVLLATERPSTDFRDFVVIAGLVIIIGFLVITRLNPKLASDYLSVEKIISLREADDAQSNARLTSSNNFQFYFLSSLLVSFYLILISKHLPDNYLLAMLFPLDSFGVMVWEWIKLSLFILSLFLGKIVIVFALTRLFAMKGLARVHFFNWMRLLLIVVGAATVVLFVYYITRGQSETFFEIFLALLVVTLAGWVFLVFMKLNGKTEHSMFHLFSYICATEIIPLLITIKVLFQ